MIFEPCDWYKGIKRNSLLDNFIKERTIKIRSVSCENDEQQMIVDYIQCVRLDEIEKRECWNPHRVETIKKWATPDRLRRLKYIREEEIDGIGGKRIIPVDAFHELPMLSREYKINSEEQEKFKISDGIHRINRARELGIDCILSSVSEYVKINKNDKDNLII